MNEKVEQCKRDIATLQEELKRLKMASIPKPRHGDIVRYATNGLLRIIVVAKGGHPQAYDSNGVVQAGETDPNSAQNLYEDGRYTAIGNVFGGK